MKYVLGVVGENGAGKDTFTTFFKAAVAPKRVTSIRFSDILYETLKLWGIEPTRTNLQNLAIIMDTQYGRGSLTNATNSRVNREPADIVVIEGVRWKTDVPMIRSFQNNILVYVTADADLRFERMRARGEKIGEGDITLEQFQREEKSNTELEIPNIGKSADYVLKNNGTVEEFRKDVEDFASKIIK